MDIHIFIALLIYLFLFNENKVIKRLILIYLIIYIFSNLYKCFFKKIIEGADTIGEPIDYNKNIYNILNDNILLLQDVNSLKQYEKKLKEDIINVQTNFKEEITTIQNKIKNNPTDSYDVANKLYVDNKSTKLSGTVYGNHSKLDNSFKELCKFTIPASGKYIVITNSTVYATYGGIYAALYNNSDEYPGTEQLIFNNSSSTEHIYTNYSKTYIMDLILGNVVRFMMKGGAATFGIYNYNTYTTSISYVQL